MRPYASDGRARPAARRLRPRAPRTRATCRCATRSSTATTSASASRPRSFPAWPELLAEAGNRRIAWGIVTNKSSRFTHRIVAGLKLAPACVVCGDSTPHLKPHPPRSSSPQSNLGLPRRRAASDVGDDLRDVQSGARRGHASGRGRRGAIISPDNVAAALLERRGRYWRSRKTCWAC